MNLKERFKGTGVAIVTPFKQDGSVDLESLGKIVEHIIDGKCEYIVVLGTTGESVTLRDEEKNTIINKVIQVNDKRLPLILGIGGNDTLKLLEQFKSTDVSGFDAILSVCPYYNKPNQRGIIKHYHMLADASPLPLMLYNVPSRTGTNITAATTLALSSHHNIFGIKEASGNFDQCMEILMNKPEDFVVISGDDPLTLPFIALGMDGVISVVANAYPSIYSEMARHCLNSDFQAARLLHYSLINAIKNMFAEGSPGGVKAYLSLMGLCENKVREPLETISDGLYQNIKSDFEKLKSK